MRRRCGAVALFFAALGCSGRDPACIECDSGTVRVFRTGAATLLAHLVSSRLPDVSLLLTGEAPEGPMEWNMTVSRRGDVCSLVRVQPMNKRLADPIESAVKRWKFQPPVVGGFAVCVKAKIFIYAKVKDDKIMLIVPGRASVK